MIVVCTVQMTIVCVVDVVSVGYGHVSTPFTVRVFVSGVGLMCSRHVVLYLLVRIGHSAVEHRNTWRILHVRITAASSCPTCSGPGAAACRTVADHLNVGALVVVSGRECAIIELADPRHRLRHVRRRWFRPQTTRIPAGRSTSSAVPSQWLLRPVVGTCLAVAVGWAVGERWTVSVLLERFLAAPVLASPLTWGM
ncbi:hypothetical protein FB384_003449 [Prauserella sediminis]|uniref:Uncharacterized protein n=1 Tax=Prauserella sediminis TaxID=577680 RepID=A0A839XXP7_9PSEU|nr:hypothetical protein [Prauserella sediminis]